MRSRARSLAMDAHIEPHQHPWSQFTYCASGLMQVTVTQGERADHLHRAAQPRGVDSAAGAAQRGGAGNRRAAHRGHCAPACSRRLDRLPRAGGEQAAARTGAGAGRHRTRPARRRLDGADAGRDAPAPTPRTWACPCPTPSTATSACARCAKRCCATRRRKAQLRDWVAAIGASERTMARLFRDELGTSYQQWRLQAILAHALPQLARGTAHIPSGRRCGLRQRQRVLRHVQTGHGPGAQPLSAQNPVQVALATARNTQADSLTSGLASGKYWRTSASNSP